MCRGDIKGGARGEDEFHRKIIKTDSFNGGKQNIFHISQNHKVIREQDNTWLQKFSVNIVLCDFFSGMN